jgi:exopolysaccharide biosynthesis polyprenyl glycosylphosphotransferase
VRYQQEDRLTEVFDSARDTRSGTVPGAAPEPAQAVDHASRSTFGAIVVSAELVAVAIGTLGGVFLAGPVPAISVGVVTMVGLLLGGHHAWRFDPLVLNDIPVIALLVGVPTLLVEAILPTMGMSGRAGGLLVGAILFVLLILARKGAFAVIRARRRRHRDHVRAIVVGCDDAGVRLGHSLDCHPEYGVDVLGYVDDERPLLADLGPMLGSVDRLADIVEEHEADIVLVAFGTQADHNVVDAVRDLDCADVEVFTVPRMYELHQHSQIAELVDGVPVVKLRRPAYRAISWRIKRLIDIFFAGLALVLASPALAVIAVLVRKETGPGIIFKQERIGLHGKPFTLFKFRSLQLATGEGDVRWSIDTDTRLGPVGKFIRASSLDELPQLFNVLKGDMSLVGPRPERPYFVERFNETIPGYRYRHRVPVGLTGYAAVNGLRGDTSIHQRAHFDNLYIESWSLWMDFKIAVWTVQQLIPRRTPEAVLPVPAAPTLSSDSPAVVPVKNPNDTGPMPIVKPTDTGPIPVVRPVGSDREA